MVRYSTMDSLSFWPRSTTHILCPTADQMFMLWIRVRFLGSRIDLLSRRTPAGHGFDNSSSVRSDAHGAEPGRACLKMSGVAWPEAVIRGAGVLRVGHVLACRRGGRLTLPRSGRDTPGPLDSRVGGALKVRLSDTPVDGRRSHASKWRPPACGSRALSPPDQVCYASRPSGSSNSLRRVRHIGLDEGHQTGRPREVGLVRRGARRPAASTEPIGRISCAGLRQWSHSA